MKRIRVQRNTFTAVVKYWAKTKQDLFLPTPRKASGCEMWWDKATEDLSGGLWKKCGKLMQWRVPRMWTYVVAKVQQEAQSGKV
jgi:hypothetical protein